MLSRLSESELYLKVKLLANVCLSSHPGVDFIQSNAVNLKSQFTEACQKCHFPCLFFFLCLILSHFVTPLQAI